MAKLTLILTLLLSGVAAGAQPFPDLRFVQLTDRDGLSCDKTTSITQDASGIIWISTENGLNRFDGFGFTRFFANPEDSTGIPANEIESLDADRHGFIWMQTAAGVCRFNTMTYTENRFDSGRNTPPVFRAFDNATMWFDDNDQAFVISPGGMYHFKGDRYTEEDEQVQPFVMQQILNTHYLSLVPDRRGGLWGYNSNHIYRVDPATRRVLSFIDIGKDISVVGLLFDSANRCWASTWEHGILEIGPNGIIGEIPGEYRKRVVHQGLEWRFNGHRYLVFGTNRPGIVLVDPATGKSQYYLTDKKLDGMGTPFIDRQNTLWVPTSNGVFYLNPSTTFFDFIPIGPYGKDFPDSAYMTTPYSMREEKSGYWIGRRYLGGMLWYSRDWKPIHRWGRVVDSIGPEFRDGPATTKEAYDFKQVGDTMFVTTEWGMMMLDLKTLKRSMITAPASSLVVRLRTIVPENDRKWWVRSFNYGVFVFDPVRRHFVRRYPLVPANCNGCNLASTNYLIRDHKGRLFASSNAGLYRYEPATDSFQKVNTTDGRPFDNSLFGMAEDRYGIVWVGQDDGIVAYDPESNRIIRTLTEGNSIGPVQRVTVDSMQNIWFRSINGYWCWLRRQDRLIQFHFSEGMPDNEEGLFYTDFNGNVYAGGSGGIVWFHAGQLDRYTVSATARIMDAYSNDVRLPIVTGPQGEKRLKLHPSQHSLQIVFDVINYDRPDNNLFYYKLSSTPGDWTPVDNGRLSFNNLAPGEYTLTVRGGNKLAGIFTATDTLVFTIPPFWYQSSWFKGLIILAILGLITLAVRRRIAHIRREAAFRQKIADTELQALRAQMNPHFIFNSLNSIENFIMKNEKWLASDYLNKFARLVRMILHSSRNELVPFSKDMEALQLYVDLEKLRYNHKFQYHTDIDDALTHGEYSVPSLLIQPYVENAILHGLALSSRDDGQVQVSASLHGDYICYRITDNGVGRARAGEVRQMNNPNHHSVGLTITENRINIFSHQQNSAGRVTITDLSNEDGSPAGTQVEVLIKAV